MTEERICVYCWAPFTAHRNTNKATCSPACSSRNAVWTKWVADDRHIRGDVNKPVTPAKLSAGSTLFAAVQPAQLQFAAAVA